MTDQPYALPAPTATGVGSLPGTDPLDAAKLVVDQLPDFVHVPELPARGVGADMIGRTASLLVELAVDLQPSGWRIVDRPGRDVRRAQSFLRHDLDAVEEVTQGYEGPLKVQVVGPLTLAAGLDRPRGDRVLADHGARRDVAQSLAEGVSLLVADLRARVPGAEVVLQLDEPSLPAVLAGAIPTSSGFSRLRAVQPAEAQELLRTVLSAGAAVPVVHCCAADVPVELLRRAGARGMSMDLSLLGVGAYDAIGEAYEDGVTLFAGLVPAVRPPGPVSASGLADRVQRLWSDLGLDAAVAAGQTLVTPTCGLAGADPGWVREALGLARDTADALAQL